MDEETRQHLFERLEHEVKSGFGTEEALVGDLGTWVEDELGEPDDAFTAELRTAAGRLFHAQSKREAEWTQATMNDAIDAAFVELEGAGIVALQNAGYTMSDGWDDANEAANGFEGTRGAIFYHGQDTERGLAGEGLMLAFGSYVGEDDASAISIAREACDVLRRHGVPIEWNGTVGTRIRILPFEWRKRREAKPSV